MTTKWRKILAVALTALMLLQFAGIAEEWDSMPATEEGLVVESDAVNSGEWEAPVEEIGDIDLFSPEIYAEDLSEEIMAVPAPDDVASVGDFAAPEDFGYAESEGDAESANAISDRGVSAPIYDISEIIRAIQASEEAGMVLPTTGINAKADIVLLIDSTGSMYGAISNVINNLNTFTAVLDQGDVNYRIAIIDYKDLDEGEETRILQNESGMWFSDAATVAAMLESINIDGGGDTPETALDALGCMLSGALTFRPDASKFAVLLTDAGYKPSNSYGYESLSAVAEQLVSAGICTSVISKTEFEDDDFDYDVEPSYSELYSRTDGIFCDIYDTNFSASLISLAEHMKKIVRPVRISLQTKEIGRSSGVAIFRLNAAVRSQDKTETLENMTIRMALPEGAQLWQSATPLEAYYPALAPLEQVTFSWNVVVPVLYDAADYTWQVSAVSDDFSVGTVCSAEDTFSVAGNATSSGWVYTIDNLPFVNMAETFGAGQYFVDPADFEAYKASLSTNDLTLNALWFGAGNSYKEKEANFLANNLIPWEGSCYGMSVIAAMMKTGVRSPSDFGAFTTFGLPVITGDTNSALESLINVYHLSQASSFGHPSDIEMGVGEVGFPQFINSLYEKASGIGANGQEPIILSMWVNNDGAYSDGHTVVCYGAEAESFSTVNGVTFDRKLLIADPRMSNSPSWIGITADGSYAMYSDNPAYNYFGYNPNSLSVINSFGANSAVSGYDALVSADNGTDVEVSTSYGRYAIVGGRIVYMEGTIDVSPILSTDGAGASQALYKMRGSADSYSVTPRNNTSTLNNMVVFNNFSAGVQGNASSATVSRNRSVRLSQARGPISMSASVNDTLFDFASVTGNASGDVTMTITDDSLYVDGAISDYTISNIDRKSQESNVLVNISGSAKASMEGDTLVVDVDTNRDGIYDVRIDPKSPSPYQKGDYQTATAKYQLNGDGTATYKGPIKSQATVKIPATLMVNGRAVKVMSIAAGAFKNDKKLKKVTIGKYVATIGKSAFEGCKKLTTVSGGAGIETIGQNAFKGCAALKAITLNKSVQKISKNAFYGCKVLKKVTLKTTKLTAKSIASGAFKGTPAKATFKCPKSKLAAYKTILKKAGASSKASFK